MKPIAGEADDLIRIQELEVFARVGVPEAERAQPQRLTVSMALWPDARFDELADDLSKTVDYAAVCHEVTTFAARRTDQLIETLAEAIAQRVLRKFPIVCIRLELRKFILPEVKYVAVSLTRRRAASP